MALNCLSVISEAFASVAPAMWPIPPFSLKLPTGHPEGLVNRPDPIWIERFRMAHYKPIKLGVCSTATRKLAFWTSKYHTIHIRFILYSYQIHYCLGSDLVVFTTEITSSSAGLLTTKGCMFVDSPHKLLNPWIVRLWIPFDKGGLSVSISNAPMYVPSAFLCARKVMGVLVSTINW